MESGEDTNNPETNSDDEKDYSSENSESHGPGGSGRKRKRIKVRKRIRIKKKPSAKKQFKKVAERVFWALIIIGFIASLIVMIVQLDIKDEKYKQKRKVMPGKGSF